MSAAFKDYAVSNKPTGPKHGTVAALLAPGGLFPELIASTEFTQTHWAAIQIAPRKKRWWEKREPSFTTFSAQYGDMRVTTTDGYVCNTTGVVVDDDTRRALEIMALLDKPCALMTRDLALGPLDHSKAPNAPSQSTGGAA